MKLTNLLTLSFFLLIISCKKDLRQSSFTEGLATDEAVEASNNSIVILPSRTGVVYAFNTATGSLKWTFTKSNEDFTEAPCIKDSVVYLKGSRSYLYAINLNTGIIIWTASLGTDDRSGSPSSVCISNKNVLYLTKYKKMFAVNAADGSIKFSTSLTKKDHLSSPTVVNGTVYLSDENVVYAVDAEAGVTKWSYASSAGAASALIPSVCVKEGLVYYTCIDRIYALDTETGIKRWELVLPYPYIVCPFGSLTYNNGLLYASVAGNSSGTLENEIRLYAVNATNGSIAWTALASSGVSDGYSEGGTGVFYSSNTLFLPLTDSLIALDASTKTRLWAFSTYPQPPSSFYSKTATASGNTVFVGGTDHKLHAINVATGIEIWNAAYGNQSSSNYSVDYLVKPVIVSSTKRVHPTVSGMTQ